MSGRGWRGEGVDDVQVDKVPRQERRWGAGETEEYYDEKGLLMGGSRIVGGGKIQKQSRQVW